jgi:hypothetical protein
MPTFDDNSPDLDLAVDRLADGELTLAERQELLSSLDRMNSSEARADGWRRCALALLEAQILRREFKAFLTHEVPSKAVPTVPNRTTIPNRSSAMAPAPSPAQLWGAYSSRSASHLRGLPSSFTLAASVLVAFGIGWAANSPNVNKNNFSSPTEQTASSERALNESPLDSRDAVTLVVNDTQGRQQRVRLPLVDAGEVGRQWSHLSPNVPVNVKTGLHDYGFDVQSKQRFAPLFFEHGTQLVPMAVPVSDTYVVPVNRPVY